MYEVGGRYIYDSSLIGGLMEVRQSKQPKAYSKITELALKFSWLWYCWGAQTRDIGLKCIITQLDMSAGSKM